MHDSPVGHSSSLPQRSEPRTDSHVPLAAREMVYLLSAGVVLCDLLLNARCFHRGKRSARIVGDRGRAAGHVENAVEQRGSWRVPGDGELAAAAPAGGGIELHDSRDRLDRTKQVGKQPAERVELPVGGGEARDPDAGQRLTEDPSIVQRIVDGEQRLGGIAAKSEAGSYSQVNALLLLLEPASAT